MVMVIISGHNIIINQLLPSSNLFFSVRHRIYFEPVAPLKSPATTTAQILRSGTSPGATNFDGSPVKLRMKLLTVGCKVGKLGKRVGK